MSQLGLHYLNMAIVSARTIFNINNIVWEAPHVIGIYDPHVYRLFKKIFGKDGRIFIDAGAYVGTYTLLAVSLIQKRNDARIISLGPEPGNFKILKTKTAPYRHLIKALPIALWINDDEQVVFHKGGPHSPSGTITVTDMHEKMGYLGGETINVRTVRLDTLIHRERLEFVDLVKMDIEGAELHVLTDPALDLSKVKNLIVEVHYKYWSQESRRILAALKRLGFKVIPIYPNGKENVYELLASRVLV